MNRIIFPLKPKTQGDTVGNLQDALQFLMDKGALQPGDADRKAFVEGLAADRVKLLYGNWTTRVVALFQQQQKLAASGEVDGPTANALNAILDKLGAIEQAASGTERLVGGQVKRANGQPYPGALVRAFHAGDRGVWRLGEDTSESDGRYTVRYAVLPGVSAIQLKVKAFDAAGNTLAEAAVIPQAKALEVVDLVVRDAVPGFVVEGQVSSRVSAGVGGLRVLIMDKRVGGDQQLAEVATGDTGTYRATFSGSALVSVAAAPDLQARVFAGDTFLAASQVRYNASTEETLDVELDDTMVAALRSEHETLTGALAKCYSGKLGDLQQGKGREDITHLANKSGWDARPVALAALADQFSARTANAAGTIPPALFYALFRAGWPANEDWLYHADPRAAAGVWKQAIGQGVIPAALAKDLPSFTGIFQKLAAQKVLDSQPVTGVSTMRVMISGTLNAAQQAQFADLYTSNRGDMPGFWKAVGGAFGPDITKRLQVNGKLGFLTLNNAPLMQKVAGTKGFDDLLQLARMGFYSPAKWSGLLGADVPIPKEIPGDTPEARQTNYAKYLAAQVRLSYPTAAVADVVQKAAPAASAFLNQHQGQFEIGAQPVEQYIVRNQPTTVDPQTLKQLKKLQRVYQITVGDQALVGLLNSEIHSAYQVARYEKDAFVGKFKEALGGAESAAQTYSRAVQVHNAVLNIAVSFLTARNGIGLGTPPLETAKPLQTAKQLQTARQSLVLTPVPQAPTGAGAVDVIAYPTLEGLFGSMDFCACDQCRSVLSPAAYLVDLLNFIDPDTLPPGSQNPQDILFGRRPDIQHLPLTCENTNTALPYIDVVNEALEYFVAKQLLSLTGYAGHDTGSTVSEDLLASPQTFADGVRDAAYTVLREKRFPAPLPFHQPLENLRRCFDKFGVSLPLAMERLRQTDLLDRGPNTYGWRDILIEELHLSREEYEILTDSIAVPLWRMYGFPGVTTDFPNGTTDADAIAGLSNAKQFSRRLDISYDDIVAILQTRFVNPNSDLIPKLARLGVPFATLNALKNGTTITDTAFDALLPTGAGAPDVAEYGGDIKAWIRDDANFARIMGLITLTDVTPSPETCDFGNFEFRYAKPMADANDTSTRLGAVEFMRLLRFIRLWKKMPWTVEQIDAAICALTPLTAGDMDTPAKLDAGFQTLLPRLGVAVRVMNALGLNATRDLPSLLACWSDIGTHGQAALYRQMFLNPAILSKDQQFADNGYGEFFQEPDLKLAAHGEALRSAFNITGDEFDRILAALGFKATTPLNIANISAIYRRGWLARKLHLSVRELLLLIQFTGLDPFAEPHPDSALLRSAPTQFIGLDPVAEPNLVNPAILRIIALVQALKDRSLNSAAALYLVWNKDLSGKSAPDPAQITELARTLRNDFAGIDDQFAVTHDPGGDIARARIATVYGSEASDALFALLDDTLALDVAYSLPPPTPPSTSPPTLDPVIAAADSRIAYDDFRHRLSYTGVLTAQQRDVLKAVAGVTPYFSNAVDALYARSEDAKGSFFGRHPELQPLYVAYVASSDPPETKRSALLAAFQPELSRRRKLQQALQRLSAAASVDLSMVQVLMNPDTSPYPLHAAGQTGQAAIIDILAVETPGLAAQFFYNDTATGPVDLAVPAAGNLDYSSSGSNPLPANPSSGAAISGVWNGLMETPEAGYYNIVITADTGATVELKFDGQPCPLTQNGAGWRNTGSLNLGAGTLYAITVTVEKVVNSVRVQWETPKRPREVVPPRYLYPPTILAPFSETYVRFLKSASLATGLRLTANELAHFATAYQAGGDGWLSALTVIGDPPNGPALLDPFLALLDFARIKAALSPTDESLLKVLLDPAAATASQDSLLYRLTRWEAASLTAFLNRFSQNQNIADLAQFEIFRRVYDAFGLVQTMGISAGALIAATTNDPDGGTVRDLLSALRARYDPASWRDVVQPVNNTMRALQRDALVACILHQMRSNTATQQIDTPDKLFEYFLMDVQMEPCMQTSRIRHALSTVQLFIERCLMNLEPQVSPAAINAKRWEWMKRYRVWEANRKVFLFPENWLEPELRDDKSPFFKEIESQLLQSDVTEETATTALLDYLSKLEEVAKLEPCGIYHLEGDLTQGTGDVDHVVARTAGANRKYYYRRLEFGYWTAWEAIKLDIEDNPVMPVVWQGRLLLFWLRITKQAPATVSSPFTKSHVALGSLTAEDIKTDTPPVDVSAILCWSEYYNGKWQPAKTSDVSAPTKLRTVGGGVFDRSQLWMSAADAPEGLLVTISGQGASSFLLYNTHSLPVRHEDQDTPQLTHGFQSGVLDEASEIPAHRQFSPAGGSLSVVYYPVGAAVASSSLSGGTSTAPQTPNGRVLMKIPSSFSLVEPHHPLTSPFDAPFLYADSRHVFYVSSQEEQVLVGLTQSFGVPVHTGSQPAQLPPLVIRTKPPGDSPPEFWDAVTPVTADPGFVDPAAMERYVTRDAYIRQGIGTSGSVMYGDEEIGPSGAISRVESGA